MANIVYFPVKYAIAQHDKIVDLTGGLSGIKDAPQLESSLLFIQDDTYYPDFLDKLTHLVYSVAMNHCFNDANKRSSIVLGAYFLEINNKENLVPVFILEMENIVLWVANHFLDKPLQNGGNFGSCCRALREKITVVTANFNSRLPAVFCCHRVILRPAPARFNRHRYMGR